MSANTPILLQILNEIREMKKDISVLKSDVADLKYYRRQQIDVSEKSNLEFVVIKLNEILPSIVSKKIPLKYFYPPKGPVITEFDGCIVLDSTMTKPNITKGYLNNTLFLNPTVAIREFIIIESKTSVNKVKVDTKLKQLFAVQNSLCLIDSINLKQTSTSFQEMVRNYDLGNAPRSVNIIFASNDISSEIKQYILLINNGISKSEYQSIILDLLKSDRFYQLLLTDKSISSPLKQRIRKLKSQNDILMLLNEPSLEKYNHMLNEYTIKYEDLEPYFYEFKGKLGIVQFDTLIFPKFT